jgi:DNA-binding response OmpR family regulator
MKPKVVLIADDNRDAAETLGMVLSLSGFEILLAFDGREALDTAERERPDAVVLDIGMPHLNGYQVAQAIRAQPWGEGLLLIALTGWGLEGEQQKTSSDAGFDHHLVKPVDPDVLERLLAA